MTRYDAIKRIINDPDAAAVLFANTAQQIMRCCPAIVCPCRNAGICERCPSGWRWALREVVGE